MKLAIELQNEAMKKYCFNEHKEQFLEWVKECFEKNNYKPIRINFSGSLWFPKSKEWIEVPTCFKYPVIDTLGQEGFIMERYFTAVEHEYIIVKLF